jgi:hypothetical protein
LLFEASWINVIEDSNGRAKSMSDLSEALEEEEAYRLWTKRLMVETLADNLAWHFDTEKELDAVILSLIGHYFTPPVLDLNNAAARAIWVEAHHKAWRRRLRERSPTREEVVQMVGETIRAMGDDPNYGLPKRTRRAKPAKQPPATILQLVKRHEPSSEDKTDENKNSAD